MNDTSDDSKAKGLSYLVVGIVMIPLTIVLVMAAYTAWNDPSAVGVELFGSLVVAAAAFALTVTAFIRFAMKRSSGL